MDHYGIGNAMLAMDRIYANASRGTGRTTSLVESVKDGDRVVFTNEREARRVERLCKERGVTIKLMVLDPKRIELIFSRPPIDGRTILDHSMVEALYTSSIEQCAQFIDTIERQTSGDGVAHRETRRAAVERSKFLR